MGMHIWDSITHLALWWPECQREEMGVRKDCNLGSPVDLSMVPSLGTWAEKQGCKHKVMNSHLDNS